MGIWAALSGKDNPAYGRKSTAATKSKTAATVRSARSGNIVGATVKPTKGSGGHRVRAVGK